MRAIEFIIESNNIASAEKVWDYVDGSHPKDQQGGGFLKSLVMLNPQYELKRVPLSSLHVPNDEDEGNDPYGRAMFVDADHAREYSQHHIDKKPLVVDSQGHILDGAHRAWAAVELLNKTDIMAWVPVKFRATNPQDLELRKNFTKQGVAEGLDEAVGGNYLYHATGADGLKGILSSGSIRPATKPQAATSAQTRLPTVSVTRDWGYASGSNAVDQMAGIARHAVLVLDRNAIESNFKTLGTSQSTIVKGLSLNPYLTKSGKASSQNTDPAARANAKAKMKYAEPTAKAGGEFEEAVVVPKGALPLKGTMVGFWVNPKSELMKDPAIMNDPRRLDMVRPNQFVKAKQTQGVAEDN